MEIMRPRVDSPLLLNKESQLQHLVGIRSGNRSGWRHAAPGRSEPDVNQNRTEKERAEIQR